MDNMRTETEIFQYTTILNCPSVFSKSTVVQKLIGPKWRFSRNSNGKFNLAEVLLVIFCSIQADRYIRSVDIESCTYWANLCTSYKIRLAHILFKHDLLYLFGAWCILFSMASQTFFYVAWLTPLCPAQICSINLGLEYHSRSNYPGSESESAAYYCPLNTLPWTAGLLFISPCTVLILKDLFARCIQFCGEQ